MTRARSRSVSLRFFLCGLSAGVLLVSGCVRTSNKDGSSGCMSSTECDSGSECMNGVCQPLGTGGTVGSTGGTTSDGGTVATGGTTDTGGSVGTGGGSSGGTEASGGISGGSSSTGGNDSGGSASGGTGGTATGGSGGNTATGGGTPGPEVIDDLEDGDGRILANSGRQGPWHVFNSSDTGAGKGITPEKGGANGSEYAMHTSGMGYTFAGLGFGLNNADSTPESAQSKAYDASAWAGVVFMVKAGSTGSASLRVEAPMRDFVPTERGGTCTGNCWNVYGFTVTTPLTTTWQEVRVPFASLQRESGSTPAFDPKQLMTISFKHTGNNDRFDFWIDDVRFYK